MEVIRERALELAQARQEGREIPAFTKQLIIMTNVEEFSKFVYLEMEDAKNFNRSISYSRHLLCISRSPRLHNRNREALPMKMRSKLTAKNYRNAIKRSKYLQHKIYKQRSTIR